MGKDKDTQIATAQAFTASNGSENYFSLGSGFNALNQGLYMEFACTTTCDSANDTATLIGSVQVDDNTSFSSPITLASSGSFAIGNDELKSGGMFTVPIAWNPDLRDKHMRGYVTVGTQDLTAGAFDISIEKNPPRYKK